MPNQETVATYFKSLTLKNVRCFENVCLDLTDENGNIAQWTLLLGDNGVGKTTLLQCLCWMRPVLVEDKENNNKNTLPSEDIPNETEVEDKTKINESFKKKADLFEPIKEGTIGSAITGEINDVLERLFHIGKTIIPLDEGNEKGFQLEAEIQQGVELNSPNVSNKNPIKTQVTFYLNDERVLDDSKTPNPKEEKTVIKEKLGEFTEPFIVTYGANRGLDFLEQRTEIVDEFVANLSPNGTSLHNLEEELTKLQNEVNEWVIKRLQKNEQTSEKDIEKTSFGKRLKIFKDAIIKILPDVQSLNDIEIGHAQVKLRIFDEPIPFSELSLGYQTTLTWVLDLAIQMVDYYTKSDKPLNEPAIVFVDELDLHLHPHWQWTIMRKLKNLFSRTQFIATSHSPLMVQSMPNANFAIVQETDAGIKIDNTPETVKGWRVDQILNSEYFGFEHAWDSETETLFEERRKLLNNKNRSPKQEARLKQLEEKILSLPTETNPKDRRAMDLIQRAAEALKDNIKDKI